MTDGENRTIISAIHEIELRLTERLTRIEAEASAWRKTHDDLKADIERVSDDARDAAAAVAKTQAADSLRVSTELRRVENDSNARTQRLTIGLVVVSILAIGRLGVNIFQMFA